MTLPRNTFSYKEGILFYFSYVIFIIFLLQYVTYILHVKLTTSEWHLMSSVLILLISMNYKAC